MAHLSETLWYNPQRLKGEEFQSFDDLLDEKFKGKIGLLDPRTPGSGGSLWAYLRDIKGEDYLKRLVGQNSSSAGTSGSLRKILPRARAVSSWDSVTIPSPRSSNPDYRSKRCRRQRKALTSAAVAGIW